MDTHEDRPLPLEDQAEPLIRVASASNVKNVASAITQQLREGKRVRVRAVGAGATNQAAKALAVARGYVGQAGMDLITRPGFETIQIRGEEVSSLVFITTAS